MNRNVLKGALALAAGFACIGIAMASILVKRTPADEEVAACVAGAVTAASETPVTCEQRIEVVATCADEPAPPVLTSVVFDPDAVKYRGAYLVEGEVATEMPDDSGPGVLVTPEGVQYTFTELGDGRAMQRPDGSWYTQITEKRNVFAYPKCWGTWWFELKYPSDAPAFPPDRPEDGFVPPMDPGALDGEKQ